MRVCDRMTSRNYLKYLNHAHYEFEKTNEQISSGKRFTSVSEDVSAGVCTIQARSELYKTQKNLSNVTSISDEMTEAENALSAISELLDTIHASKLNKAKSETVGENGRIAIAAEIRAAKEEIVRIANTKFGKKSLFGGTNGYTEPFCVDKVSGKLLYNGVNVDNIQRRDNGTLFYVGKDGSQKEVPMNGDVYMDIGMGIRMSGAKVDPQTGFKISYSGLDILGWGKTDGKTNNIYNLLDQIESTLKNYNREKLDDLDNRLVKLTDGFRTHVIDIGAKTNFLNSMKDRLTEHRDALKVKINDLIGTDDKEASTNQMMNDYVLKAILQMGSKILPLSLMDFLH